MAAPDEATYGFSKADAGDLVQLIGNVDGEHPEGRVRGGNSQIKHFAAPVGGIPARSGSTLGSATCTLLTIAGGTRAGTSTSHTVYNNFTSAVGASADIVAARINGIWSVIAEDCA